MSVNAAWESISCITLKAQMASPPALHPRSRIYQVTSAASNLSFPSPLCVILFQPHEERLPVEFHFIKFALSLSIVLSNKVSSFVSFWNLIYVLGGFPWCCGQSQAKLRDGPKGRFNFNIGKILKNQSCLNMKWISLESSEFIISGGVPSVVA